MKTVFFGSGEYTIPVVKMLQNHELGLVVTTETEGKFYDYLQDNSIPHLVTHLKNSDDIEKIKEIGAEIGVLGSYGAIVPNKVIQAFPHGIINIHPSLLPIYKGPSPVQYAIKNGDKITGVTIISLDDQIDHGVILSQKEFPLNGTETLEDLKKELFKIGSEMIEELLKKPENGKKLEGTEQDHTKEIFTYKVTREDGRIDLAKIPTSELEISNWKLEIARKIRAFYPWPGVWFETVFAGKNRRFKLLPDGKIQMEGKNIMTYKDFMNGYGEEGRELVNKLEFVKN